MSEVVSSEPNWAELLDDVRAVESEPGWGPDRVVIYLSGTKTDRESQAAWLLQQIRGLLQPPAPLRPVRPGPHLKRMPWEAKA